MRYHRSPLAVSTVMPETLSFSSAFPKGLHRPMFVDLAGMSSRHTGCDMQLEKACRDRSSLLERGSHRCSGNASQLLRLARDDITNKTSFVLSSGLVPGLPGCCHSARGVARRNHPSWRCSAVALRSCRKCAWQILRRQVQAKPIQRCGPADVWGNSLQSMLHRHVKTC